GGAPRCARRVIRTNNAVTLRNYNDSLKKYISATSPRFDCTLTVLSFDPAGDERGRVTLAHSEHIINVMDERRGGGVSISTANGFEQGNRKTAVPAYAGINYWTSNPGGTPSAYLRSSESNAVQ